MSDQQVQPAEANTSTKQFSRGGDTFKVPISRIRVEEGFNQRDDANFGDIDELASNIQEQGQLAPGFGYIDKDSGNVILTAGHRRLKAFHVIAGRTNEEPTMLIRFSPKDRKSRLMLQFAENVKQANTDWDKAQIIKGLLSEGMENGEIIQKLGMKAPTFYALKKLLEQPESVQERLRKGEISGTVVNALARVNKDADALAAAVEQTVNTAQASGKKKATARHAPEGDTRTTTSILKTQVQRLEAKAEEGALTKNEQLALSLFSAVLDKNSDRTIKDKIAGK